MNSTAGSRDGLIFIGVAVASPLKVMQLHGPLALAVMFAAAFLYLAAIEFAPPRLRVILIALGVIVTLGMIALATFAWWAVAIIGFGPGFGPSGL